MRLDGPQWRTPEAFDDGEALWQAVCEHELEGLVAKRRGRRKPVYPQLALPKSDRFPKNGSSVSSPVEQSPQRATAAFAR
jgi:hypothetical protein